MNMAFVLGEGCASVGNTGSLDGDEKDPNKCFRLSNSYEYSEKSYLSNSSKIDSNKAINMFMVLEGYVDSKGDS